jgi:hypothetical protein
MCDHTRLTNSTTLEHHLGWAATCPDNATDSCRRRTIRTSNGGTSKIVSFQWSRSRHAQAGRQHKEPSATRKVHPCDLGQLGPSCSRRATTYLTAHFATGPTSSIEPSDRWPLGWCLSTNHHPTSVSGTRHARRTKNQGQVTASQRSHTKHMHASKGLEGHVPAQVVLALLAVIKVR